MRPYNRYSSVRSYFSLHVGAVETIADHSVTLSAPELRLSVLMNCRITFAPSTYFSEALPPHPSHSYGYDTAIGVALTRRTTPITLLFICDERVLIAGAS